MPARPLEGFQCSGLRLKTMLSLQWPISKDHHGCWNYKLLKQGIWVQKWKNISNHRVLHRLHKTGWGHTLITAYYGVLFALNKCSHITMTDHYDAEPNKIKSYFEVTVKDTSTNCSVFMRKPEIIADAFMCTLCRAWSVGRLWKRWCGKWAIYGSSEWIILLNVWNKYALINECRPTDWI